MTMFHDNGGREYFTRVEANAFVGRSVRLNSGETVTIDRIFPEGKNTYSLVTIRADGSWLNVLKSDKNGIYVDRD
jgi:hypothetical protein